jgi:hypothetical protein
MMATSFSGGIKKRQSREDGKISSPLCNLQSRRRTHAVLVIGLYELLGNPTTELIEPPDIIKFYYKISLALTISFVINTII